MVDSGVYCFRGSVIWEYEWAFTIPRRSQDAGLPQSPVLDGATAEPRCACYQHRVLFTCFNPQQAHQRGYR